MSSLSQERSATAERFEDFFSDRIFDAAVRGYARSQVDAYVHDVQTALANARRRTADLETQLGELQGKLDEYEKPTYRSLGARAAELLRVAEEEAGDILERTREQARVEYDEVLDIARQQADEVVRTARRDAQQVQADAQRQRVQVDRQRTELDRSLAGLRRALDQWRETTAAYQR